MNAEMGMQMDMIQEKQEDLDDLISDLKNKEAALKKGLKDD